MIDILLTLAICIPPVLGLFFYVTGFISFYREKMPTKKFLNNMIYGSLIFALMIIVAGDLAFSLMFISIAAVIFVVKDKILSTDEV